MGESYSLHGRRPTVHDLLLDMGAKWTGPKDGPDATVMHLFGVPIVFDDDVPPGVVEYRLGGRAVKVMVQDGARWLTATIPAPLPTTVARPDDVEGDGG